MNILIVTQYFYPEIFRINDLAFELQNSKHNITVLTSVPNYPVGKFYQGYGIFKRNRENFKGIKIYRAPVIPRGIGSPTRLAINYFSYIVGSIFASIFVMKNKLDIIFVFEPSPITVGLPAVFIKKIKRIPIVFWVLDLWPESVVSAGNLKSSIIPRILIPLVKFIYHHADKILVSSNGFIKSIVDKGVSRGKIEYFPQWAEPLFKPLKPDKYLLGQIPIGSFKIMFAGNIGESQDFPSILEAARILRNDNSIHWIILGAGRKEEWVKSKIKEYKLGNCFHMLGSFPLDKMPKYYSLADVMLLSLKKEYIFSITIPAKVQSYMACGKPILAMIDGEASKIIQDANAGMTCHAEDPQELAKNVMKMKVMLHDGIIDFGGNARKYYDENFERSFLFNKAEQILSSILSEQLR